MDIQERLIKYLETKALNGNKSLHSNTIKNYLSILKIILRYINYDFRNGYPTNYDWLIDNYEDILNAIESGTINQRKSPMNFQTKKNYYIVLINLIKSTNDPNLNEILFLIETEFNSTRQQITNFNNSYELTQRQMDNLVSYDAIKQALDIWKNSIPPINSRQDYLNLAFYTAFNLLLELPIKSELANTKIIYNNEPLGITDYNYIILNPNNNLGKIIVSKKSDIINIAIPPHLIKDLKHLKKFTDIYSKDKFFITNQDGSQMSQPSFSNTLAKYAKEYFPDKRIGINIIKLIAVSKN